MRFKTDIGPRLSEEMMKEYDKHVHLLTGPYKMSEEQFEAAKGICRNVAQRLDDDFLIIFKDHKGKKR